MDKKIDEKWIKDTALIFYQIFSVDYESEKFLNKLLQGGGGNSTLCSTWTHLSDRFIKYRISVRAYNLLISKIEENDRKLISFENGCVTIPSKIIYKKYASLFFNNAKGANNRKSNGKYFHFDHNPSNKKVLILLRNEIKANKDDVEFLSKLSDYIRKIQTVDLITVEEDDIRTLADLKLKEDKMDSSERDAIINSVFYDLNII